MLILSRRFLVIFLVLLQFIAPLVHAHAGKQFSGIGVHLPGLERYNQHHPESISQAVNSSFDSDAVIVGVNTGIERQFSILSADTDDGNFFDQVSPAAGIVQPAFTINFSPQATEFVTHLFSNSYSPRAPPAQ